MRRHGQRFGIASFSVCLWTIGFAAASPAAEREARPEPPGVPFSSDTSAAASSADLTVEKLTESARKSVVVITVLGRDGRQQGLGSGFVIHPDGLIATNLHVIGEARPIQVQTADGRSHEVLAVEAFDRPMDLAILRIGSKNLPALPLGDSDTLRQGQSVVALGNPQGLKHSVVSGVVSGTREIEARQMIQLAIPIEPGNSGGPLLDLQGRVHGILTMKSAVTENLGFAMPVNTLKPLIAKPNPTLIARWLTIGALDPAEWKTIQGARWRQRAGRILVEGTGAGFGGRALCLSEQPTPEPPYEIAVSVKLDQEEGAAGLAFCANGSDVHYGFYPSGGKLRLTRFDGPDVFSWQVLAEVRNEHYRPGDWNTLKVRFEKGKIQCFVNDQPAIASTDTRLTGGKVGLAKFRTTEAEFRGFRVARELPVDRLSEDVASRIAKLADELAQPGKSTSELAVRLAGDGPAGVSVLRERARQMEAQARELRKLANSVHQQRVQQQLIASLTGDEAKIDLFQAALFVAQLDNDEVDVESYGQELERMARELVRTTASLPDETEKLRALNRYLFEELGFHGSRGDYYHRSNSYVNEVLDDREGLPITLAVIYIELAKRLGVNVVGVGVPGHFLVRHEPAEGTPQLIDVFERGTLVSRAEAEMRVRDATGRPPQDSDFTTTGKRAIIVRMLHNLLGLAQRSRDIEGMFKYLDCLVALTPEAGPERWMRAVVAYQLGRRSDALKDTDWVLEHRPEGVDIKQVEELRRALERAE